MLILSSYSLPVAVSKMVSARLARGQYRNARKILRAALFYATIVGGVGFCALWFGSGFFAEHVIKMPYSAYALKVLAPTVWIMAYLGVLRGFFQGHSTMVPTAVSQIFEQIVNAVISLLAAKSLFDPGYEIQSGLRFYRVFLCVRCGWRRSWYGSRSFDSADLIRWPVSDVPSKDEAADTQGTGNVSRKLWYDHQYLVSDCCADHRQQQPL